MGTVSLLLTVHCTAHYTLTTVHCNLYIVHYILFTVQCVDVDRAITKVGSNFCCEGENCDIWAGRYGDGGKGEQIWGQQVNYTR